MIGPCAASGSAATREPVRFDGLSGEKPLADSHSSRGWARVRASVVVLSVVVCAFALYWVSGVALEVRRAPPYFGADTWYYTKLAQPDVIGRISTDYHLDRIARFHPTTVGLAVVWMKIVSPLSAWFDPAQLLRGMSAAVGAVGVWAAMSAFAAVLPRRYAVLFGVTYALSFGVWYFASIEESKIVTATLSSLYIAGYLHLRQSWSTRRAAVLLTILLLACLNEIVCGLLIVIPLLDALMQRRLDLRHGKWIAAQMLAGVLALVMLEGVLNRWLLAGSKPSEEASHFAMLLSYVWKSEHGAASLYQLLANWLFFNIAAPTARADFPAPAWEHYKGYFEPSLTNYLASPATAALVVLLGLMAAACLLARYRTTACDAATGVLVPLAAYSAARGAFFFIFNPAEALLFSPAVTLAHLLIVGVPFATSSIPAKRWLLAAFAALLLIVNGRFIFAP